MPPRQLGASASAALLDQLSLAQAPLLASLDLDPEINQALEPLTDGGLFPEDGPNRLLASLAPEALEGLVDGIVKARRRTPKPKPRAEPASAVNVMGGIRRPTPSMRTKPPTEPMTASMGPPATAPKAARETLRRPASAAALRGTTSSGGRAASSDAKAAAPGSAAAAAEFARAHAPAFARAHAPASASDAEAAAVLAEAAAARAAEVARAAAESADGAAMVAEEARRRALMARASAPAEASSPPPSEAPVLTPTLSQRLAVRTGTLLGGLEASRSVGSPDDRMREMVQIARMRSQLGEESAASMREAVLGLIDDGSMDWSGEWREVLTRHRSLNARREELIVKGRSSGRSPAAAATQAEGEGAAEGVRLAAIDLSALGKGDGGGDAEDGAAIDKAFVSTIRSMVDDLVTQAHVAKRALREKRRAASGEVAMPYAQVSRPSPTPKKYAAGGGADSAPPTPEHPHARRAAPSAAPPPARSLARPASAAALHQRASRPPPPRAGGTPTWLKSAGADWLPKYGRPGGYAPDAPSIFGPTTPSLVPR